MSAKEEIIKLREVNYTSEDINCFPIYCDLPYYLFFHMVEQSYSLYRVEQTNDFNEILVLVDSKHDEIVPMKSKLLLEFIQGRIGSGYSNNNLSVEFIKEFHPKKEPPWIIGGKWIIGA